jgi:hypothetical protein
MLKAVTLLSPTASVVLFLLSACATHVYQNEIATFKIAVDSTVDAFETLRTEVQADVTANFEKDLASQGAQVATVGDCTVLITSKLQADAACLARWASYRATPSDQRGSEPPCPEPARDPNSQELMFYDLAAIAKMEMAECRLGIRDPDSNVVSIEKLEAGGILENTAELGGKLKEYAGSLAKLADAEDSQELKSAVGDAKTALEKLADRVQELTKEEVPGRAAIGPVSELLGTALIQTLEARRFAALKSVVGRADPVIARVAKILSRHSMPLMIPKLRAMGTDYLKKTEVFNNQPKGEDWIKALVEARQAKDRYITLYNAHPTATFQAMAEAHTVLKEELDNPDKQFDAMKSAIEDFATKAKAAYDVLVKEKSETKEEGGGGT